MGQILEDAGLVGPGFGDFLMVAAYTEARGNPNAGSDDYDNKARGMWGLRPISAWNERAAAPPPRGVGWPGADGNADTSPLDWGDGFVSREEVAAIKDLPWAVALITHYIQRNRAYLDGVPYTMLGARRGMAYPYLVSDEDNSERPEVLTRPGAWLDALRFFGMPESFSDKPLRFPISRSQYPSPHELHAVIVAGIEGRTPDYVPGTYEGSLYLGDRGHVYAWAFAQRSSGPWTWTVDRWPQHPTGCDPQLAEWAYRSAETEGWTRAELLAALISACPDAELGELEVAIDRRAPELQDEGDTSSRSDAALAVRAAVERFEQIG
jgi:hypothetical protein